MKRKNTPAMDFVITFTVVFVVGMIIAFFYNLVVYGTSIIDGEASFRLALTLAISLGIIRQLKKK
jgi:hypothetical protein